MRTGGPSKALSLVAMLLFVGLLAGCGGGGESGQGGQGDGSGGGQGDAAKGQGGAANGDAPQTKIALGRVIAAKPDTRKVIMRTNKEAQGGERMVFKVKKNAEITLDGEKTDMAGIKPDQQVQIEYVAKEKVDRATTVRLFAPVQRSNEGEGGEGGGEGSG